MKRSPQNAVFGVIAPDAARTSPHPPRSAPCSERDVLTAHQHSPGPAEPSRRPWPGHHSARRAMKISRRSLFGLSIGAAAVPLVAKAAQAQPALAVNDMRETVREIAQDPQRMLNYWRSREVET